MPCIELPDLGVLVAAALAFLTRANGVRVAVGATLFVSTLLGSSALVLLILCRLPVDFLTRRTDDPDAAPVDRAALAMVRRVGKNLLGAALVVIGIVMSVPGVPGQGVLTVLVGLLLMDIPGKKRLEQRLIGRPRIVHTINRMRTYFAREPLEIPDRAPHSVSCDRVVERSVGSFGGPPDRIE